MNTDIALEVKNVVIKYRFVNSFAKVKDLFRMTSQRKNFFTAVDDVSFVVKKGEIVGILGKNGCGKSTLLRAIAGVYSPNSGYINIENQKVSLMALGLGFEKELSGRENIMLSGLLMGFSENEIAERMDDIIEFSELESFIDNPIKTYSSGMYSKLAFSIGVIMQADILLLDEVLSVGDLAFRRKSLNRMKEIIKDKSKTVIIVSHSTSTIEQLCDKAIWMDAGKIKMVGEVTEVSSAYTEYMEGRK